MDFMQAAIAIFRSYAFGDLSPREARKVKEARDLLSNGWPGGPFDVEWHGSPDAIRKHLTTRRRYVSDLASGKPEQQRKALKEEGLKYALAEEITRNQNLRALRYLDEIPTHQLNLKTARQFCEFDLAGRPDFEDEDDSWRKSKFPDIADEHVRNEASIIWRKSSLFVFSVLIANTTNYNYDDKINTSILEEYQRQLMGLQKEDFQRRLENIEKVASAPIPLRMKSYAEYMARPDTLGGLKELWEKRAAEGFEQKYGWIRRIKEKILISPAASN